jgi:hypothetical protein
MRNIMLVAALAALTVASPAFAAVPVPAGSYGFNFASANYSGNGTLTVNSSGVATNASGTVNDNGFLTTILGVAPVGSYGSNDNLVLNGSPFFTLSGLDLVLGDANIVNLFTYFDGLNYETNIVANPGGTDGVGGLQQLTTLNVAAVPEPSTWAMMLLGFGAVGFSLRRSQRRSLLPQLA